MQTLLWLIPLPPLAAFALISLFTRTVASLKPLGGAGRSRVVLVGQHAAVLLGGRPA